jgi:hypothetical protein
MLATTKKAVGAHHQVSVCMEQSKTDYSKNAKEKQKIRFV